MKESISGFNWKNNCELLENDGHIEGYPNKDDNGYYFAGGKGH